MTRVLHKTYLPYVIPAVLCLPVGTACHEIIGHGLVGVLCGGRISSVKILGMQVWPSMHWQGWDGTYGRCGIDPPTERGRALCKLTGSMSTWAASILAIIVLSWKPWHGWKRAALLSVGIWWVDLLTYTLPTWGIPRSILWGGHYSEPYNAATELGVPGPLFQAFVVISSVVLAYFWIRRVRTYSAVWRLGNRSQP